MNTKKTKSTVISEKSGIVTAEKQAVVKKATVRKPKVKEKPQKEPLTKEYAEAKLREMEAQEFKDVENHVTQFLQELGKLGYGLDADFNVSRNGVKPRIFVVRYPKG